MKGLRYFAFAGLILAMCSGSSTGAAAQSRWIGKRADDFFATKGPASALQRLSDGRRLYIWSTSSQFPFAGTLWCTANITVSPKGIITNITARHESWGALSFSRCAEVLNE
jgi:hypothetical protein